jgi:hypothetical protein
MDIRHQLSSFTYEHYLASKPETFCSGLANAICTILKDAGADLDHEKYLSLSDLIISVLRDYGHGISHTDYDGTRNHYGSWEKGANQLAIIIGFKNEPTYVQTPSGNAYAYA